MTRDTWHIQGQLVHIYRFCAPADESDVLCLAGKKLEFFFFHFCWVTSIVGVFTSVIGGDELRYLLTLFECQFVHLVEQSTYFVMQLLARRWSSPVTIFSICKKSHHVLQTIHTLRAHFWFASREKKNRDKKLCVDVSLNHLNQLITKWTHQKHFFLRICPHCVGSPQCGVVVCE